MIYTIGEVAYRLDLPPEVVIHNVFHISQIKLKLGQTQQVQHIPLALMEEFKLQLLLETMLRVWWNSELEANEWLVNWKGLSNSEATRESVYLMNKQFPTFQQETRCISSRAVMLDLQSFTRISVRARLVEVIWVLHKRQLLGRLVER